MVGDQHSVIVISEQYTLGKWVCCSGEKTLPPLVWRECALGIVENYKKPEQKKQESTKGIHKEERGRVILHKVTIGAAVAGAG